MKTKILIIASIFLISCGSSDKQADLDELIQQKENLVAQIEQLPSELAIENNITGNSPEKKIQYVKTQKLQAEQFKHYIEIQGNVESENDIIVPAQSSGIVKNILVEKGDIVKKGQLLAKLDAAVFELTIEELKTAIELATTVFERQQRLWNQKIGSEIQFLQAKNQKVSLDKKLATTMEQYEMTKIKAPMSGQIDEVFIKEGEMAAAGFPTFKVFQVANLKIKAILSEKYITDIKVGDLVNVFVPVLNKNYEQKVLACSNIINPDNRTFNIEISIPQNDRDLKPNMVAVLNINDYSNDSSMVVPLKIVQFSGEKNFLFVASKKGNETIAEKRYVEIGYYFDKQAEIISGIIPGEEVVISGYQNLGNNETISIQ